MFSLILELMVSPTFHLSCSNCITFATSELCNTSITSCKYNVDRLVYFSAFTN